MIRRDFLALAGAVAWPNLGARAAAHTGGRILRGTPAAGFAHLVNAFRRGLNEAGFVEGQNVAIEFRWADDQPDRLPLLASELVRESVAVIVGDTASVLAAKRVSRTTPIVFAGGGDPVKSGLVGSLNRPGGNVTGVNFFTGEIGTKRMELLRQLLPAAAPVGMLVRLGNPTTEGELREVRTAAQALGQPLIVREVRSVRDIERAFATFGDGKARAVLVGAGTFLNSHHAKIVALAARYRLPASYVWRDAVVAGGLMSYGTSITDAYRQAGVYAGRILKGEKPSDLPVMQLTKFELVLNLQTAKALALEIPDRLLALADEVIE